MCLDLRLAAALCHENGKGQQFPLRDGQELTGIEVTKAVGGKIVLNVLLIFRRGGTHGVDMLPENGFLCGDAIRQSAFLRDGLTARPRQGNAFFRQYLIDSVHSIFSFAKTDIGRAMVSAAFSVLFILIPPDPSTTLFHLSRFNSPRTAPVQQPSHTLSQCRFRFIQTAQASPPRRITGESPDQPASAFR